MHLSRYALAVPLPDSGRVLLFCMKNGALALVDADAYERVRAGLSLGSDMEARLAGLGLLVDDPETEKKEVLALVDRVNEATTTLHLAVIPGMGCNFDCPYCYEGRLKNGAAMTRETAARLIAFIKERLAPPLANLHLDFYGGEPLLYVETIEFLAGPLQEHVEARGGIFRFSLITNGSLLTPDVCARLALLGMKGARITVDGPADIHDANRPYRNGAPSFAAIVKNIRDCCDLIPLSLSGNYQAGTFRRFPELLDFLITAGLTPGKLSLVSFYPVMAVNGMAARTRHAEGCGSCNEPWVIEAAVYLREEIMRRGFGTPKITPALCMVEKRHSLAVHYDGSIYKCPGLVGDAAFQAGDIWRGMGGHEDTYKVGGCLARDECRECRYYPLCLGGCRFMAYQRDGELTGVDCLRPFLEGTLVPMLLQDPRYRHGAPA